MNFLSLQSSFDAYIGVKDVPNTRERTLFERAEKYIRSIENIPGIEMIAIANSLSMFATHEDSDIDLFIVTKPNMLWFVRLLVTLRFWRKGVWRRGEDIAGNFCLSFFITTNALNLKKIAIKNDIYLYYWIYYLKPIIEKNNTYENFLRENRWVEIPPEQKGKNLAFIIPSEGTASKNEQGYSFMNSIIRFFLRPKTLRQYEKLGRPEGVIISNDMLKFHDQDRRKEIRDAILGKNFDK